MYGEYQRSPRAISLAAMIVAVLALALAWLQWTGVQSIGTTLATTLQDLALGYGVTSAGPPEISQPGTRNGALLTLLWPLTTICGAPLAAALMTALALALLPLLAWRIALRLELDAAGAAVLALALLLAPATGWAMVQGLHGYVLAGPLLLLLYGARQKQQEMLHAWLALLGCFLGVGVALLIGWMSVVHAWVERRRREPGRLMLHGVSACLGFGFALGELAWSNGGLSHSLALGAERFAHLGGWLGILTQPGATLSAAWRGATGGTLVIGLLLPLLFMPCLRLRWLVIAAPFLGWQLLAPSHHEWMLQAPLAAMLMPLLWLGAAEACGRLFWRESMARWILLTSVVGLVWLGPLQAIFTLASAAPQTLGTGRWERPLLHAVHPSYAVLADERFLPHLAARKHLHPTSQLPKPGTRIEAAVLDAASPSPREPIHALLLGSAWAVTRQQGTTFYLRMVEAAPASTGGGVKITETLSFLSAKPTAPRDGEAARIEFTWEHGAGKNLHPAVTLDLLATDARHTAAMGLVGLGQENCRSTEEWVVHRPASLRAGKYRAVVTFYDPAVHSPRMERRPFDLGEIDLR